MSMPLRFRQMSATSMLRKLLAAVLTLFAATLLSSAPADATHFRHGHLTWVPTGGGSVEFTLIDGFRRSGFSGTGPDGFPAVGDVFLEDIGGTNLFFGDGGFSAVLYYKVISIDPANDWLLALALEPGDQTKTTITHLYASANNAGSPWIAEVNSCCRSSEEQNNPDWYYRIVSTVDLTTGNRPPSTVLPAVVELRRGGVQSFMVPAADPDSGEFITWRLATPDEAADGGGFVQPPGLTVQSSTGQVDWNTTPRPTNSLWSCQVVMEDHDASTGTVNSSSAVDFLIRVGNSLPGLSPNFVPPSPACGSTRNAQVGQQACYTIKATDDDPSDVVTLNTAGIPTGATLSPELPVSGRPVSTVFCWTPTMADLGPHLLLFTATDQTGKQTLCSFTIDVVLQQSTSPTQTALEVSPPSATCGEAMTLTAHINPSAAGGTVQFYDGATPLGGPVTVVSGDAVLTLVTLAVGPHVLFADYSGNSSYDPSASPNVPYNVTRAPSSAVVSSDRSPATCGQRVHLTAAVTPAFATGTIQFLDAGVPISAPVVVGGGAATLEWTFEPQPTTHLITAYYNGDSCVAPSTSAPFAQRADSLPTTIALTADNTLAKMGTVILLTASVTPATATGLVRFFDQNGSLGQATLTGGVATLSLSNLPAGQHQVTASYGGDSCRASSVSNPPVAIQVVPDNPPVVTVVYPNGGETIIVSGDEKFTWTVTDDNLVASVSLYLSRNYGQTYVPLAVNIPNTGSFVWRVVDPSTNTDAMQVFSAVFKVTATDNAGQIGQDQSNHPFSIYNLAVPAVVTRLETAPEDGAIVVRWELAEPGMFASIGVERAETPSGPWSAPSIERSRDGSINVATDRSAGTGRSYWYRLVAVTNAGTPAVFGPVSGMARAPREFALAAASPNPTRKGLRTQFSVPRSTEVKLSLVDLQGREVAVLAAGYYAPGRYQVDWDGRSDRGAAPPAGLYFLRCQASGKTFVSRVTIAH